MWGRASLVNAAQSPNNIKISKSCTVDLSQLIC